MTLHCSVFIILLLVATYRIGLVSKEMDLSVLCKIQEPQTEGLIPANGEDVEADLSTNGILESNVRKCCL